MKMLKYIFAGMLCLFYAKLNAQTIPYSTYSEEAVLFSQPGIGGTGRTAAIGGASTSLGGDISSISANPAGLGFYNRSAFSFSPVIRLGFFETTDVGSQNGNNLNSAGLNIQLPNLGLVLHKRYENGNGWISGTFGVGINQESYFYNKYRSNLTINSINGETPRDFAEYASAPFINSNGFIPYSSVSAAEDAIYRDIFADLAYDPSNDGLISIYNNGNGEYEIDRYDYEGPGYLTTEVARTEEVITKGGLTNMDFSYGANYQDVIFLGASLNLSFLNYDYTSTINEVPNNGIVNSYEIKNNRLMSGVGIGATVGVIFKPINTVNLGVSYTSPRIIGVDEVQTITLNVFGRALGEREIINEIPTYSIVLPQKVSGGATFFLSKYGFITADISLIDYSNTIDVSNREVIENDTITTINSIVQGQLKSAINANLGAEVRLGAFRLRGGYAFYKNPYQSFEYFNDQGELRRNSFNQDRNIFTAGIGLKLNDWFLDAAINIENRNNNPQEFYSSGIVSNSNSNINMLRLTFGTTF